MISAESRKEKRLEDLKKSLLNLTYENQQLREENDLLRQIIIADKQKQEQKQEQEQEQKQEHQQSTDDYIIHNSSST